MSGELTFDDGVAAMREQVLRLVGRNPSTFVDETSLILFANSIRALEVFPDQVSSGLTLDGVVVQMRSGADG